METFVLQLEVWPETPILPKPGSGSCRGAAAADRGIEYSDIVCFSSSPFPSSDATSNTVYTPSPCCCSRSLLVGSFLKPSLLQALQPLHPVVVATRQLHVSFRLRQGVVSQPLLEHRCGDAVEDGAPPVGVPEGMGVGPCGV